MSFALFGDTEIEYFDDIATALDVMDAMQKDTPVKERLAIAIDMVFPHPDQIVGDGVNDFIFGVFWEAFGIDLAGTHAPECAGTKTIDWVQDAERIRVSLLSQYGLSMQALKEHCSFGDVCSLIGMADRDTPIGRAIYYRTAKEPRRQKGNEEAIREFRRMRDIYAIKEDDQKHDPYEQMNNAANSAFVALERAEIGRGRSTSTH